MWHFISQVGLASTTVDFTNDLSLLLTGLLGLVWLSAGMIVWAGIQHHLSQIMKPAAGTASAAADTAPAVEDYKQAA